MSAAKRSFWLSDQVLVVLFSLVAFVIAIAKVYLSSQMMGGVEAALLASATMIAFHCWFQFAAIMIVRYNVAFAVMGAIGAYVTALLI